MIGAIGEGEVLGGVAMEVPLIDTPKEELYATAEKTAEVFANTSKGSLPEIEKERKIFRKQIIATMGNKPLGRLIFKTLVDNGLERYEKHLGKGTFGNVFQIAGTGAFEGEKLALKLIPRMSHFWSSSSKASGKGATVPSSQDSAMSVSHNPKTTLPPKPQSPFLGSWKKSRVTENGVIGDGIALEFPKDSSLCFAYGALIFDGEKVQYVESIDIEAHKGWFIIGVLLPVAEGGSLQGRVQRTPPLGSKEIKMFGKNLAQALHQLHGCGYEHRDLHSGNVLLLSDGRKQEDSCDLLLSDFGLARKKEQPVRFGDWFAFAKLLLYMTRTNWIPLSGHLHDLLYNDHKGLLVLNSTHYTEEEILRHPYFADIASTREIEESKLN